MTTILIADDDRVWVELLGAALRKAEFDVVGAFDVMQATMLAVKHPPGAIVLDVRMPGGSGLDALKRIKMSTKTSTTPVVVVSGMAEPGLARVVAEMGAAAFLKKPVTPQAVCDVVRSLLAAA